MLASARAKFGPLTVQEYRGARILTLNGQVQGGSFMEPSADCVRPGLKGPGPISCSCYTSGWLAAGACHPRGSVLMIGLGSGAGVVSLLYNFPEISVDVVEIDPVMIEHAIEWFPLVAHYIDIGRLRIHEADATEFVSSTETKWDVLCSDGYTGTNSIAVGTSSFYGKARKCASEIWLNWIGVPNGFKMMREFDALGAEGWTPETVFVPSLTAHPKMSRPRNWILTSEIPKAEVLDAFEPFADFEPKTPAEKVSLNEARQVWSVMLDNQFSADELAGVDFPVA